MTKSFSDQEEMRFADWLEADKAARREATPPVLFHGTTHDFKVFERGDVGFHFGSAVAANNRLANKFKSDDDSPVLEGAQIIPVLLSIKRPLRLKDAGDWDNPDMVANVLGELITEDDDFEASYIAAADACVGPSIDSSAFADVLKQMGYDGIVYDNVAEGGGDSYIAFDAAQIRFALCPDGPCQHLNIAQKDRLVSACVDSLTACDHKPDRAELAPIASRKRFRP